MMPESTGTNQDPRTILKVFWRWKVLFVVVLAIPPIVAYLLQHGKPKSYRSSVVVSLQQAPGLGGQTPASQNVLTVARLITTSGTARAAATFLHPTAPSGALLGAVSVSADTDTGFITISAQDHVPARAAAIANAFASALSEQQTNAALASLDSQIASLQRQLAALPRHDIVTRGQVTQQIAQLQGLKGAQGQNAKVVEPAVPSGTPVGASLRRDVEIGVVIGLLLAIGLVLVAENSDRRLRNPDDLEEMTGMAVLGSIPRAAFSGRGRNADHTEEAFQMLRASLAYFNVDERLSSVMVVSPGAEEGKTTVAVGLAKAAALAGRRVILLDADLRRPQVAVRLGLDSATGLGPVLAGEAALSSSLINIPVDAPKAGRLQVLPAGPPAPNPTALLGSAQMRLVVKQLEAQADLVIVDTPAALAVSDSLALLQATSGVVVVVRMNRSSRGAVRRLHKMIVAGHGRILGAVATGTGSGENYGYGYDHYAEDSKRGRFARFRPRRRRKRVSPMTPHQNGEVTAPVDLAAANLAPGAAPGPEAARGAAEYPQRAS
jgi:capsular exopolysaccharide synthesis family protein